MKDKKHTQLEFTFSFNNDRKHSNVISFPYNEVLEKNSIEKEAIRQEAIKKGIEKCAKSLRWYK